MKRRPERILRKLREAEVALAQGESVTAVCKKLGVTANTYDRWRKEYGGLEVDQAKRLEELERENARLRRIVADRQFDTRILKEAASGRHAAPSGKPRDPMKRKTVRGRPSCSSPSASGATGTGESPPCSARMRPGLMTKLASSD